MDRSEHFASVKTRIKGHGRFCSSAEEEPLFRGSGGHKSHPAEDLDDSRVPEWLKVYVTELDRKLDQLLGVQSKKDLILDFPITLEIIELSGNRMTFRTGNEIEEPCFMEAVLEIEQVPLKLVGALGKIRPGPEQSIWVMDFTKIREHDLESIIQFVFSEQREQIRAVRLG